MAKKKLLEEKAKKGLSNLEILVERFLRKKPEFDGLKKEVDSLNKEIKAELSENNITEYAVGDKKVTMSTSVRTSYDEDKLLSALKPLKIKGLVVKKEVVDQEVLEKLIYDESIQEEKPITQLLESIAENKEVVTLKVGKA